MRLRTKAGSSRTWATLTVLEASFVKEFAQPLIEEGEGQMLGFYSSVGAKGGRLGSSKSTGHSATT